MSEVHLELLSAIWCLVDLTSQLGKGFYWTRQVARALRLISGRFSLIVSYKGFEIQSLDFLCDKFLTKAQGLVPNSYQII